MKNHTETNPSFEQKLKFAIKQVITIRNRIATQYHNDGCHLEYRDDKRLFRALGIRWLNRCAEAGVEEANLSIEDYIFTFAESFWDVYQA